MNHESPCEPIVPEGSLLDADYPENGVLIPRRSTHSDGHLTSRGTFQKLFEQTELKNWIDQTLDVTALPAGPGVFYVFRNDEERVGFQASRYRRRAVAPRLSRSETLFNEHEALLQPLIDFWVKRGRMPAENELGSEIRAIREVFGSPKRAFQVIKRVTDAEQWDEIVAERTQDLQLYLALSQFDGRPRYSELPEELKHDVKAFFSNYTKACQLADELLFSLGDPEVIDAACRSSEVGKLETRIYRPLIRVGRWVDVAMAALAGLAPVLCW